MDVFVPNSSRSTTPTTDTIKTPTIIRNRDDHSTAKFPCCMENYRSNAFPFGLGWRKSPHESPHTHTSLFPIPIAVGDEDEQCRVLRPCGSSMGVTQLHDGGMELPDSPCHLKVSFQLGKSSVISDRNLHSRIPWGLDCPAFHLVDPTLNSDPFDMDGFPLGPPLAQGDVQRSMPLMNSIRFG
jgi:hypothetical protein